MSQAPATPLPELPRSHCPPPRGRRSFAANNRRVHDSLRPHTEDSRLLDSPLVSLPGVQRLARRRVRRSAFADVHATRALLQPATERASAILTARQALALQLYCDGQPMAVIAARLGLRSRQHLWAAYRRPAVEAVTHEFLAVAQAEFSANSP